VSDHPAAVGGLHHVVPTGALVPPVWLRSRALADFFVFNPAIVRHHDRLLMTYRVDFGRAAPARTRIACAICVLDERFQVTPGSVVALSDTVIDGGANHFDPRFVAVGDRLFVHYNNNRDTQPNQIFLVELDPQTLAARAPARALHLDGPRQPIEKNWMLFAHEGDLFAIYQIDPHIVLHVDLDARGAVRCRPVHRTAWGTGGYTRRYGAPHGGAPPVRVGDHYIAIFHSRTLPRAVAATNAPPAVVRMSRTGWFKRIKRWLRQRLDPLRYFGGVYGFAAAPPFAPIFIRPEPLLRPDAEAPRRRPAASDLTPRRVVYPSGLVRLEDDQWLVSYGVHDERCVLRMFSSQEMLGEHGMPAQAAP
jgi:predicted GH43/DUF377 family glycosyl hydrolase